MFSINKQRNFSCPSAVQVMQMKQPDCRFPTVFKRSPVRLLTDILPMRARPLCLTPDVL